MAPKSDEVLRNIQAYAQEVKSAQESSMDVDETPLGSLEAELDATIKELQARVSEHRTVVEALRASSDTSPITAPSTDKRERLRQLQILRSMYEDLTPVEPDLPRKGSLLPTILALQTVRDTTIATKKAITHTHQRLRDKTLHLQQERADLADSEAIADSLTARISRLRTQNEADARKTPAEIARELIVERESLKRAYEQDTERLHDALTDFIDDRLAALVAAEELGGPVTGDALDIDDELLAQRISKRQKVAGERLDDDGRRARIERIWGTSRRAERTEREAAAEELHLLVRDLIAALIGENSTDVYIEHRDSAAARFLIRARVAQYHPKDARRIRLVDFGREIG